MSLLLPRWLLIVSALLSAGFLADLAIALTVERFWFEEVNYLSVFMLSLSTRLLVWGVAFVLALAILGGNSWYAWRSSRRSEETLSSPDPLIQSLSLAIRSQRNLENKVISQLQPLSKGLLALGIVAVSALLAWFLADAWLEILAWLNQTAFGIRDPLFDRELAFYLYSLPVLKRLQAWDWSLWLLTLLSTASLYGFRQKLWGIDPVLGDRRLRLDNLSPIAQKHLLVLGSIFLVQVAWGHWLSRYDLLYSERGVSFGANYTDVHAQLPANGFLVGVSLLSAAALFWLARQGLRRVLVKEILCVLAGYGLSVLLVGILYPQTVQAFIVSPNELGRERPYIERSIQFTRQGFNLTKVEAQAFDLKNSLTRSDIQRNQATIKNIRLWDPQPLLETYKQLQEIRPYYQFPSVDVDRYTIDGTLRQVMHAARELDYSKLPQRAKTWVNEHFFYTHGYGFTLSPVNAVTPEGLPDFFVKDIPPRATSQAVQAAIPIDNAAIYYGELARTNVFVSTADQELDYPQGGQNVYTRYTGTGGVAVGQFWQRLLYAWHFRDLRLLLVSEFTPKSRFLFRRNLKDRVQAIAPFLRYDRDPYLVIAEGGLYWILDAYTTSHHYPYSELAEAPFQQVNYIRNAVKVVVDAYDGSVDFYISDSEDPLIQTYRQIFHTLFKPLTAMPRPLKSHLRYPEDLFQVQAHQYATYHMNDPQVFYNKEDQWQLPSPTLPNSTPASQNQPMRPYYAVLKLPEQQPAQSPEEFVLLTTFTPAGKENLIAWMAARCDGEAYGRLLVYEFSKQSLVLGPMQVEARINQSPEISEQITLWNQQGSRINWSDLLVIPIENSLLYVQSLYLEAEQNSLPQLTRVIAAYQDRVVMYPTLEEALQALFASGPAQFAPLEQGSKVPAPSSERPLAQKALQQWQQAQNALKQGNWAEYGRLQTELRRTLEELAQPGRR